MKVVERILIVDDDESICRSLELILQSEGYVAESVHTASDALSRTRKKEFELIILDNKLPDKNGIDLLPELKEAQPDINIIIITGFASVQSASEALENDAAAYMVKPVNVAELLLVVKSLMDKHALTVEKKRTELELRKLSRAIEHNPTSIVMTDNDGTIEYVNPRFIKLTGYSPEEVVGKNSSILQSGQTPAATYVHLWETLTSGMEWNGLFINKKKNGDIYWEEAWISPILGLDGEITHFVAVKLDVTERMKGEALRNQYQRELELYSSLVRHDLKNDVAVILANVDAAGMIFPEDEVDGHEVLASIEAVCNRMITLLDAVTRPIDSVETDIVALVRRIASQTQEALPELTIDVITDKGAEALRIQGSRLVHTVFENLFRNAAFHASEDAKIEVRISRQENSVRIVVSDNGPGVAEEVRDRLFTRGVSTRGSGLGLYLSREIIKTLGGTIELLDAKSGEGAVFQILLPISY